MSSDTREKIERMKAGRQAKRSSLGAYSAKIEIRENVKREVGGDIHVLDLFAGSGQLARAVYADVSSYTGCDLEPYLDDPRRAFVVDNLRLLRAIDLGRYNLFDLDAYGSPWHQVALLAARRRLDDGERIGLVLTDGSSIKIRLGLMPMALAHLAGVDHTTAGAFRELQEVVERALHNAAGQMGGEVLRLWQARQSGYGQMRYMGAVIGRQKKRPAGSRPKSAKNSRAATSRRARASRPASAG